MENIVWAALEFSEDETKLLASFRRDHDSLDFSLELATWRQWVVEFERGELLSAEEVDSACSLRDELDATCLVIEDRFKDRIFKFLDDLDLRYRNSTVQIAGTRESSSRGSWWWGRIPVKNAARAYLLASYEDR